MSTHVDRTLCARFQVPGAMQSLLLGAFIATEIGVGSIAKADAEVSKQCAPRADFIALLNRAYDEVPAAVGLTPDGRLLELFASRTGSTWTMAMTLPSGITCIVLAGTEWHMRQPHVETRS